MCIFGFRIINLYYFNSFISIEKYLTFISSWLDMQMEIIHPHP